MPYFFIGYIIIWGEKMEQNLLDVLKESEKPIVLYGMGNGADKIADRLSKEKIKISGVFASDGFVRKKLFRGFPLSSYGELKESFKDMIILVCFGSNRPEVLENINRLQSEQELYVPEVPVYGNGLFTREFVYENKDRFKKIYSLLADEKSRQTFEKLIDYKISGKTQYLFDCEVSPSEPYNSFLNLTESEIFVDLGAYNGDTVKEFIFRTNGSYSAIYAAEPDIKSFKKLTFNTSDFENIHLFNACITEKSGTVSFAMGSGRGSSKGGETETSALCVDDMLFGIKPTFIKYDVEGEEINAIRGAEKTIIAHKPKMLISAYHRNDDLLTIPEEVLKLRDDYKIYLRHFPYLPAWDTNYYFI